jgi:dipeptidyl aminopeptidase/acylaminoacyl peptidase
MAARVLTGARGYPNRMRVLAVAAVAVAGALAIGGRPAAKKDVGVLVIDAETGARQRITARPGGVEWSHDGSLLYVSGDAGLNEPATQTFETFDTHGRRIARRVLRSADVAAGEVAVAPDGRIAYIGPSRDREEVNTGELIVAGAALLSRARGTPAWSPDGTRVAVERWSVPDAQGDDGGTPPRTVVVGTKSRRVLGTLRGSAPSWLSDGRLLVLDGTSLVLDGRTILRGVRSDWDVRGGRVAVAGDPIRVVSLDDGAVTRLTGQPASDVSWSPDGTKLAAVAGARILILDAAGATPPRELTRIAGRGLSDLEWSPDGARLAVAASVPSRGD